uniref:Uncharacterized protein n=1 Tax=Oryza nivara TaxID=4536 RepID=A0A0E0J8E9_ORYNI
MTQRKQNLISLLCLIDVNFLLKNLFIHEFRMIDRTTFIACAGELCRADVLLNAYGKMLREQCDKLVPGIGTIIKDHAKYANVMVMILTPQMMCFPADVVRKIEEADAAADDAREKVDCSLYYSINRKADKLEELSRLKAGALRKLKSLVCDCSGGQKRSLTEVDDGVLGKKKVKGTPRLIGGAKAKMRSLRQRAPRHCR